MRSSAGGVYSAALDELLMRYLKHDGAAGVTVWATSIHCNLVIRASRTIEKVEHFGDWKQCPM